MKNFIILLVMFLMFPLSGLTQNLDEVDFVSPMNDGVIAIKKGKQWAFIDAQGNIVINFRDDFVLSKQDKTSYPVFSNDRCLITQKKDGISYFGYIDKTGAKVIKPQFLNASNFYDDVAIVLALEKQNAGRNEVLGKNVVYYEYYDVIIDKNGNVQNFLSSEGINVVLDKKFLKAPPKINSKFLSKNLIAVKNKNKKWIIKNIDLLE